MQTRGCFIRAALTVVIGGIAMALSGCSPELTAKPNGPAKVELRREAGHWQLCVDRQPFFIKGAGGAGSLAKLKAAGANSIRTWGADNLQSILDEAQQLGLKVCAGIWLHHEHDAERFDYSQPEMVKAQLAQVRQHVLRFKDHPALLMWGLGNEMEGEAGDKVEIWNAVQEVAKLTKVLDPNHPTMTVIAELGGQKVENIHKYCPDIDIIGINSYGGGPSIAERYAKLRGSKPYIVAEFGTPGPWETGKTSWGAAYEPSSTEKSESYRQAYKGAIEQQPMCLGSFAFLWGQKQETTVTWFGMFLKGGEKLQAVDTMTELWSGEPPAVRCPVIKRLEIRGAREFAPGATIAATLEAVDPQGQPLEVRWVVQPEQTKRLTAGAEEAALPELTDIFVRSDLSSSEFRAPQPPGGYRLFAYVRNGDGAAVANVPFLVLSGNQAVAERK